MQLSQLVEDREKYDWGVKGGGGGGGKRRECTSANKGCEDLEMPWRPEDISVHQLPA